MPQVMKYDVNGKELGNIELPASVFNENINEHAVHQVVVAHMQFTRSLFHNWQKYVKVLLLQRQGEKLVAAERNHGARKEPVEPDMAVFVPLSGLAVG